MTDFSPNPAEQAFLELGYNRFLDLYKEVDSAGFWEQPPSYRFHRIRDVFAIYDELTNYVAIAHILATRQQARPVEHDLGERLFSFIRNLLAHFPLFDNWNDVWIDQQLATWERTAQIHKFLSDFDGKPQEKFRFYDTAKKQMLYVAICYPTGYLQNRRIRLAEILPEHEGVRFSIRLMLGILLRNVDDPEQILAELRA